MRMRSLRIGFVCAMSLLYAVSARAAAITIFDEHVGGMTTIGIRWGSGGGSPFNGDFVVTCPGYKLIGGNASDGVAECSDTSAGVSFSGTFFSPHGAQTGATNVNYYEYVGGPLSDTLTFTLALDLAGFIRVTGQFISDGGGPLVPLPNALTVDESVDPHFGYQTGVWAGPSDFSIVATSEAGAAPVPEPASLLLLGSGIMGAAIRRRFRSA